ncbi:hypothetical protein PMNALOAF_2746 [Methylobacterium adhaesivum]|nr:hypothetical protein PMNALOAF_2746 [Methylobacterium adhaesivum]
MTARDRFAQCDSCGWHGLRADLVPGPGVLDELCPECSSEDTVWTDEPPPSDGEAAA